ncbi:MAG: DUF427 domain-containing protein [Anaerolineales bacterium]
MTGRGQRVQLQYFTRTSRSSVCQWKGRANYYTLAVRDRVETNAAWFYPDPFPSTRRSRIISLFTHN